MTQDTKQSLLDRLERYILIIDAELIMVRSGLLSHLDIIDELMPEVAKTVLALKKLEGIPSNLKLVEESEPQ